MPDCFWRTWLEGIVTVIPAQMPMLGLHAGINTGSCSGALRCGTAGLLVGILPSLRRRVPIRMNHEGRRPRGRGAPAPRRQTLVVAEIALSVILLLGAGLLIRSFLNLQRVDPGYEPKSVLTMRLTLPRERYPEEAAGAFFDRLIERIAAEPGVRAVSAASQFPPQGVFDTQFTLERGQQAGATLPTALITVATPSHFETLRVPLRAGRIFSAGDRLDTPRVVIVNQSFAARYLPGIDPVGQRMVLGSPDRPSPLATIVGVVSDFRNSGATTLRAPRSTCRWAADGVESVVRADPHRRRGRVHTSAVRARGGRARS